MHPDLSPVEGMAVQEFEPVLMRSLQRFRALLPGQLGLALELAHEDPHVRADAARLEHALLSVFIVAWHSMAGVATQIVVELSEVLLDEVVLNPDAQKLQGGLPPRRYARLVVSNNSRVATGPFHTLLPAPAQVDERPSSAHRLQLVEVRDIIAQCQGMFNVLPEAGHGTAFDIYLPTSPPLEGPSFSESESDAKHIIYVDDYAPMRMLISETLPEAGFGVTCYETGQEALAALRADPLKCDAVVSDHRLQGFSGIELLKQIKQLRPELPVIIISGYVDAALEAQAREEGAALLISKASDISELCVALHRLLGQAPRPALVNYSDWAKL